MGRPRTGSVFRHADHFDVQITMPNGKRSNPICLPASMSEKDARAKAKRWTADAIAGLVDFAVPVAPSKKTAPAGSAGELADTWFDRYFAGQSERGYTSVDDNRGRWRKWCAGRLGRIPMRAITRDDLEGLVEDLDACVRLGALSWKTAANTWGLLTKGFAEAQGAKARELRVLEVNPCAGVRGPDHGSKRSKAFCYPSEFATLMACPAVPAAWRRLYAVTTYLYLRAAEARGLEWADVDLDHGVVTVHRTVDDEGRADSTKGMAARRVPIEPAIVPLLKAMREAAGGAGRVLPTMPVEKHLAPMLRRDMKRAGLARADLVTNDATRKWLTFHDLRATGLTWRAVRGDEPLRIMQAAGHKDFGTTMGYVRTAEQIGRDFGAPFPALPDGLVSQPISQERVGANGHVYGTAHESGSGRRDLKPPKNVEKPTKQGVSRQEAGCDTTSKDAVTTRSDVEAAIPAAILDAPACTTIDAVEAALADALGRAAAAGEWSVVAQLGRELEARRSARTASNVVAIDRARRR